jgi:hypothetical protein
MDALRAQRVPNAARQLKRQRREIGLAWAKKKLRRERDGQLLPQARRDIYAVVMARFPCHALDGHIDVARLVVDEKRQFDISPTNVLK